LNYNFSNVLKSAVDYMYIPGDEEHLFAHLIQPLVTNHHSSTPEDTDYHVSSFLLFYKT